MLDGEDHEKGENLNRKQSRHYCTMRSWRKDELLRHKDERFGEKKTLSC